MTGYGKVKLKSGAPAQEIKGKLEQVFSDVFADDCGNLTLTCDGGPLEDEALDTLNSIREHVAAGDVYMECPLDELESLDRWRYHFDGDRFVCQRAEMRWTSDEDKKAHPFTVEELESAMYGVIDYVCGDPSYAAEVIRNMDISDDMAAFFGYDPREDIDEETGDAAEEAPDWKYNIKDRTLTIFWKRSDFEKVKKCLQKMAAECTEPVEDGLYAPPLPGFGDTSLNPWIYPHLVHDKDGTYLRCALYTEWNGCEYDAISCLDGPEQLLDWEPEFPEGWPFGKLAFELADDGMEFC